MADNFSKIDAKLDEIQTSLTSFADIANEQLTRMIELAEAHLEDTNAIREALERPAGTDLAEAISSIGESVSRMARVLDRVETHLVHLDTRIDRLVKDSALQNHT